MKHKKNKMLTKKGIVFTITAIVIGSIIITGFFALHEKKLDTDTDIASLKLRKTNTLIRQIETYTTTLLTTSSKTTINFMNQKTIENNSYFNNYEESFKTCLTQGTTTHPGLGIMICPNQTNITAKLEHLKIFAEETLNTQLKVEINNITLNQSNPWELNVHAEIKITVRDPEYAYWNTKIPINTKIDILGLKDPTYGVVNITSPAYPQRFLYADIPVISNHLFTRVLNVSWSENSSTLNQVVRQQNYFEHNESPSYLDRLKGNMTPSSLGIASIVSARRTNYVDSGNSHLDWIYWKDITYMSPISAHNDLGTYNFSTPIPINIEQQIYLGTNDTDNGLHGSRVPVYIAQQTNMSNSTYFN